MLVRGMGRLGKLNNFKGEKMGMFNWWIQKKELEIEVKRLGSIIEIEKKKLQADYDILATRKSLELTEHEKRYRMEMEDKLNKQATLYNEALSKINVENIKNIAQIETDLAKSYYEKMIEALRDINLEGNVQTKFMQELSLKMFDKALEKPMPSHFIEERIVRKDD